jgi:ketosteroid isomerase-like protein
VGAREVEIVKEFQPSGVDMVEMGTPPLSGVPIPDGLVSGDLEVEFVGPEHLGQNLSFRGQEGLAAGWSDWLQPWSTYWIEAEEFIDAGDHVVAFARVTARTKQSDVEMQHAPAAVWTFAGGRLVRIAFYLERDQALAAAGLGEPAS